MSAMVSFADRWNAAGAEGPEVPDGNYDVEVIDASAFNRRSDGAEFAKLTLQVQRGELQGRTFDHFMNLNNQVGIAIARDALAMYGLSTGDPTGNVESWAAFQAAIQGLIGVTANVSRATRNGFAEVKVNSSQLPLTAQQQPAPASPPPSGPAPAAPVAAGDEDIPFLHDGFPSYDARRSRVCRW